MDLKTWNETPAEWKPLLLIFHQYHHQTSDYPDLSFFEIREIISNSQDKPEPRFFLRTYTEEWESELVVKRKLYPYWHYNPIQKPERVRIYLWIGASKSYM